MLLIASANHCSGRKPLLNRLFLDQFGLSGPQCLMSLQALRHGPVALSTLRADERPPGTASRARRSSRWGTASRPAHGTSPPVEPASGKTELPPAGDRRAPWLLPAPPPHARTDRRGSRAPATGLAGRGPARLGEAGRNGTSIPRPRWSRHTWPVPRTCKPDANRASLACQPESVR